MSTLSWSMSSMLATEDLVQEIRCIARISTAHEIQAANNDNPSSSPVGWRAIVDQLLDWHRDPHQFEGDLYAPPSPRVIEFAIQLSRLLRDTGLPPPARVVPNGEGGIVFECENGVDLETVEIDADGTTEFARFHDAKLVSRRRLVDPFLTRKRLCLEVDGRFVPPQRLESEPPGPPVT